MVTEEQANAFRDMMVSKINPTICIIGCVANIFNMLIFTRKNMRSSTNTYLTALSLADFFYLFLSFMELLNHYRFIHFHVLIYFYLYASIVWLKEAFSYISISITVAFTIERYIAVRYPIHRQRLCTESNAKKIIIAMFIFCCLATVSRNWEYAFIYKTKGYNKHTDSYCDAIIECKDNNIVQYESKINSSDVICIDKKNYTNKSSFSREDFDNCKKIDYYKFIGTDLHYDENYKKIMSVTVSIVFVVLPVIILIIFNSFLIYLVREASFMREKLTENARSKPSLGKKKSTRELLKISQENKITIVLIGIVLLFLACQIPWALFVIFDNFTTLLDQDTQLKYVLATIGNFLADVNSALNFILYCGLSEEYRRTAKLLMQSFVRVIFKNNDENKKTVAPNLSTASTSI